MNKTVILIQLIISSSLPNPIDEIIISKDVVDFEITDPVIIFKIEEGNPVQLKVDDTITNSEVNQRYKIYSGIRRFKGIEKHEATTIFTTTTTNSEMDGTSGDDLEDPTDSPIEFNFSNNAEEEFESNIPNDEYNSEWDLFDDTISTRRMMNNFEELSEEIKEITFTDSSPNVSEVDHRLSGVDKKQKNEPDDDLKTIQNQNIIERIAQRTSEIKKEKINKHFESIKNYKVEENNEHRAFEKLHAKMRISNLDHGLNDKKYGSKSTEVPVIQSIPFIYPSPSEAQRYKKPAIPMYTINSDNFNNHKLNRISPVARIQDIDDYSSKPYYRKHLYKPAVLSQKSLTTNIIISKLVEATENSHKFAASNEYFKNKKTLR